MGIYSDIEKECRLGFDSKLASLREYNVDAWDDLRDFQVAALARSYALARYMDDPEAVIKAAEDDLQRFVRKISFPQGSLPHSFQQNAIIQAVKETASAAVNKVMGEQRGAAA